MESLNPTGPGLTRRDVLRAAGGLGLAFMLPALEGRAAESRGDERPKSLITLWLDGGPSQLETWDPHPGTKIGGETKSIPTAIPGLEIADLYPRLAERLDRLSVIRSLTSKEGDHERGVYYLKTGYRPDPTLVHPSLGAILAHERPDANVEIPSHVALAGGRWPGRGGFLGDRFDAFKVFNPGRGIHNMRPRVGEERQARRLKSLDVVGRTFRRGRPFAADRTLHAHTVDRALTMMSSAQLEAFDLQGVPQSKLDAYGDTRFGRGCLVAGRLVGRGVRAVEVTLNGFDSHANNFAAHRDNAAALDPAFRALLDDLEENELLDSTIVLCLGEFGRTPTVNALDGRDHWPHAFSCLVGGGGLRSGVVIGATDPTGKKKEPTDPIEVHDLFATIVEQVGLDPDKEFDTPIGRPMAITSGSPIERLLPT